MFARNRDQTVEWLRELTLFDGCTRHQLQAAARLFCAVDVEPGQALCIPRGAVHRFDNNNSLSAKALCLVTPASIGPMYFREAAAALNAAAGGPPDRAKMAEIMRRHGLTPAH